MLAACSSLILLVDAFREECKFCVTVANPQGEDFPLIAVSEEFETMTGYTRNEIIGENCRFLNQGVDMNPQDSIAKSLKQRVAGSSTPAASQCDRRAIHGNPSESKADW